MISDCKKKMVKESRDQHLHAAYHEGKSHGLSKMPYSCRHDDMEEARMYHEGYKCGLDECYGQQPIVGYVGEETDSDIVDTMASYGARGMEEGVAKGASAQDSFIQKLGTRLQNLGYKQTQQGNVYRWIGSNGIFVEVEPDTEDPGWYGWAFGEVQGNKLHYGDSGSDPASGVVSIFKSDGVFRKQGVAEDGMEEGVLGTLGGGALGTMLGGPVGGVIGAGLGQAATTGGSDLIEGLDPIKRARLDQLIDQFHAATEPGGAWDFDEMDDEDYTTGND